MLKALAYIYKCVTDVRNWMFDHGWLKEQTFNVPTIGIGNLAVGGTGKTPHTEWVAQLLINEGHHVATLSRGYGRKTKGYLEANVASTASEVGDEPLQMFRHFSGRLSVHVCENRCKGMEEILLRHLETDVVVLDDAFQHRYIKPGLNILLTDFHRLYTTDQLIPAGRLREDAKGAQRADVIIVTKCPTSLTLDEREAIINRLHSSRVQHVFFSTLDYEPLALEKETSAVLLTGIANPEPLVQHIKKEGITIVEHQKYADHHNFTAADLKKIEQAADQHLIITTAKDAARLSEANLSSTTRKKIIVQNIVVKILFDESTQLINLINAYVNTHQRDGKMA